jgi:hypothetical protein
VRGKGKDKKPSGSAAVLAPVPPGKRDEANVVGKVLALKQAPTADLKVQWRSLFDMEPPPYNRRFLESRLAYRIQELAFGGLKLETVERLDALADQLYSNSPIMRRIRLNDRPIAGTQLIRVWQGAEHSVTVRDLDYEYQGRPYKSLSSIARAIRHPLEWMVVLRPEELPERHVKTQTLSPSGASCAARSIPGSRAKKASIWSSIAWAPSVRLARPSPAAQPCSSSVY